MKINCTKYLKARVKKTRTNISQNEFVHVYYSLPVNKKASVSQLYCVTLYPKHGIKIFQQHKELMQLKSILKSNEIFDVDPSVLIYYLLSPSILKGFDNSIQIYDKLLSTSNPTLNYILPL